MQKNECLKLRECPFCGGTAHLTTHTNEDLTCVRYFVKCIGCLTTTFSYKKAEQATAAWNRRAGEEGENEAD